MDAPNKDEIELLNYQASNNDDATNRGFFKTRMKSASFSCPNISPHDFEQENHPVSFTGPLRRENRTPFVQGSDSFHVSHNHEVLSQPPQGALQQHVTELNIEGYHSADEMGCNDLQLENFENKNEHLLNSGRLGMCDDPYCMTCPTYYNPEGHNRNSRTPEISDAEFHGMLHRGVMARTTRICSFLHHHLPGVVNPHAKFVQKWRMFLAVSCLFSAFLDPFFFFLLSVEKDYKCIVLNWPLTVTVVALRSMADFMYLLHILLQFRLAYVAPESRVMGAGVLVDDPKKIFRNYLCGYFIIDFFVILPLPQIIILLILPDSMRAIGANYAKNHLATAILVQYIPKLYRFWHLLAGQSLTVLVTEAVWPHIVVNLLTYIFASHVVGSCWYLFGLQRVQTCLRMTCRSSAVIACVKFIDCGQGNDFEKFKDDPKWEQWRSTLLTNCFSGNLFDYGIYRSAVSLTTHQSVLTRYVYSLFWGFQQITTLPGNQNPSFFIGEILFTSLGLLFFSLFTGNIQNYLQGLEHRRAQASLRRLEIGQWMIQHHLPEELKRKVREAEHFDWALTKGANEQKLMETLPEDLQRDILRYLLQFVRKVRLFQLLDEPVVDAICEKLRTKTHIKGSEILYHGGLVDKMVFIMWGKMESIGKDQSVFPLSEGDVCGEELLSWCLEHSSVSKDGTRIGIPRRKLLSDRLVRCLTNVEAYILLVADLEEITSLYARSLRSPHIQGTMRYESPFWRELGARRIQVMWRYRKKRLTLARFSKPTT